MQPELGSPVTGLCRERSLAKGRPPRSTGDSGPPGQKDLEEKPGVAHARGWLLPTDYLRPKPELHASGGEKTFYEAGLANIRGEEYRRTLGQWPLFAYVAHALWTSSEPAPPRLGPQCNSHHWRGAAMSSAPSLSYRASARRARLGDEGPRHAAVQRPMTETGVGGNDAAVAE
jgi:hypothetical protein